MKTNHTNLSADPIILHQIINALSSENNILSLKIGELIEVNCALKEQLILLKKQVFGQSSEKINKQIEEIEQRLEENEAEELAAPDSDTEEEEDVGADDNANGDDEKAEQKTPKRRPRRTKLPENLPRTQVIIPAPTTCPDCGGDDFRTIANDVSEVLEYVPASFKVTWVCG
jgi:transposase